MKAIFSDIEHWIAYRTYDRYHVVQTGLTPNYYETDTIILHANFELLVKHVEIGLASLNWFSSPPTASLREKAFTYIDNIIKEIIAHNLEYPRQDYKSEIEKYQEVKELYIWWKDKRPNRTDPYVYSGVEEFSTEMEAKYGEFYFMAPAHCGVEMKSKFTEDEDKMFSSLMGNLEDIEYMYEEEDTNMLCRLIKIRSFLST